MGNHIDRVNDLNAWEAAQAFWGEITFYAGDEEEEVFEEDHSNAEDLIAQGDYDAVLLWVMRKWFYRHHKVVFTESEMMDIVEYLENHHG